MRIINALLSLLRQPSEHVTAMVNTDIEAALIASLGGGTSPGIDPVGIDDRIEQQPESVRDKVESYLDRTMDIPLPDAPSLSDIGDIVAHQLASEMPELSDVTRRKLANYYTYEWR
jgi:hypothetical protein